MKLSARAKKLRPSATLAITAKEKALKAQGVDVIGFGAGEPDFDSPENVKEEAIKAIRAGFTKFLSKMSNATPHCPVRKEINPER